MKLRVSKDLCSDIILGHDFQKYHRRLTMELHGSQSDLIVSNSSSCALATAVNGELYLIGKLIPGSKLNAQNIYVSVSQIEHLSKKRTLAS